MLDGDYYGHYLNQNSNFNHTITRKCALFSVWHTQKFLSLFTLSNLIFQINLGSF
jgi:hypothetical protein